MLRKRAARVILSSKNDSPSVRFVNNLNWIPFYEEKFSNLFQVLYPIFYRDMLLLIIKFVLEILDMLNITQFVLGIYVRQRVESPLQFDLVSGMIWLQKLHVGIRFLLVRRVQGICFLKKTAQLKPFSHLVRLIVFICIFIDFFIYIHLAFRYG